MKETLAERPKFWELDLPGQVEYIMKERTPSPEEVIYQPRVEFLDPEGRLTREEKGRVIALGDRTAISYKNLAEGVIADRDKEPIELEGEEVSQTASFYLKYPLAARSSKEIAHTSILEQVNVGAEELGGDSPILLEGVSILSGLRDIAALRHFAFEAFSSRGGIFPEKYWRIPRELHEAGIGEELDAINQEIYDIYLHLTKEGIKHHLQVTEKAEGEKWWEYQWRVLNLSLDDSRQVTNSSFLNHLSMHPNSALSLREALVKLSSSELLETREIADRLRELATSGLPTLMRYTEVSPYTQGLSQKRREITADLGLDEKAYRTKRVDKSRFINASVTPEAERVFLAAFIAKGGEVGYEQALEKLRQTPDDEIGQYIDKVFADINLHDKPPEELEMVQIVAHLEMSVGAIYEAIRHRLATHIVARFTPYHGYTIPEAYFVLGLDRDYIRGLELNERQYDLVKSLGVEYEEIFGPYFVSRGHLEPVTIRISGLDVFHFLKIRNTLEAHPDISNPSSGLEYFLRGNEVPLFRHLVKKPRQ